MSDCEDWVRFRECMGVTHSTYHPMARDVSDGGVIVGDSRYSFDPGEGCQWEPFIQTQDGGMVELGLGREQVGNVRRGGPWAVHCLAVACQLGAGIHRRKGRVVCWGHSGWMAILDESNVIGDFDEDGDLDWDDLGILTVQLRRGSNNPVFDLSDNGTSDMEDRGIWIKDLKMSWFGDANLDGEFNSSDLVSVLSAGEYEDGVEGNSGWATGDWDGDGDFSSADLVVALADGGYEQGPRAAVNAVPEPTCLMLMLMGVPLLFRHSRSA
jgi:hypothetical protein